MIVLVGESASGKSSIEKELVCKHGYKKITSYTTRPPRCAEVDGQDYHFISKDEFDELVKNGFFAEYASYNGWNYGTAEKDCLDDRVAVLTPHGLRQMRKVPGLNITACYINVPRRDRLIKILLRGDDIEEAYRRSLSDVGQFDGITDEVDFVINNPKYELSVADMTERVLACVKRGTKNERI